MPPKSPACCRAVQGRLLWPTGSLWIHDGVLQSAFDHFYAFSRTARRYGSSIPGPMECRRRTGKRRMTYQSEAVNTSSQSLAVLWGLSGAPDMTQWQWEAPKPRPAMQDAGTASLPAWLAGWETTPAEVAKSDTFKTQKNVTIEEDWGVFRNGIGEAMSRAKMEGPGTELQLINLVESLNQSLKQNLALGLVTDEQLSSILELFSQDMRPLRRLKDPGQREKHEFLVDLESRFMTTIFQTVWEGIKTCRVLRPVDMDGSVMNTFLLSLRTSAGVKEVQTLVRDILQSVSANQLIGMTPGLISFVKAWSVTWSEEIFTDCSPYISAAEAVVSETSLTLRKAQKSVFHLEEHPYSTTDLLIARKALGDVTDGISRGIDAIIHAEDAQSPWRVSAGYLAETLETLPPTILSDVFEQSRKHNILKVGKWRHFQYRWLSTAAKMRSVDDKMFSKLWMETEACVKSRNLYFLSARESSDLILTHWASQGYFTKSAAVRNIFEALSPPPSNGDFGFLICAVDICRENHWEKTQRLFDLLVSLDKHRLIPKVLKRLLDLPLVYKPSIIYPIVMTLAARDPHVAWWTFKTFNKVSTLKKSYANAKARLEYCPELVVALIRDPQFDSNNLWRALKIPRCEGPESDQGILGPPSLRPLRQTEIDIIHLMAQEFSNCSWRSRRVIVRNLMQCAWYLRYNRVPLSPILTKAFNHACITRDIIDEQWIHADRARWVLKLIAWVEGEDIAASVADTATQWRDYMKEQHAAEKRRTRNPINMYGEI